MLNSNFYIYILFLALFFSYSCKKNNDNEVTIFCPEGYELLLREMSTKDLTNLIVDYIKNENLFKLLLLEDKLATSFTSLVTVLGMDNEGTLERNTDGKDPLPEEYVEKIIKKQYPEANQSVIQKAKYESQKFECKNQNS